MSITGRCLCGDVTFEITGDPIMSGHCHCRDCQRSSGTGHTAMIAFAAGAVSIRGPVAAFASPADSGAMVAREFCSRCGSRLFGRSSGMPGMVTICAGALDDPAIFQPMMAVYTSRRQPWDHLPPGVPQFEMMPPGM